MWTYQHHSFAVHQLPVLRDNYLYLIETSHALMAIDPALPEPVYLACAQLQRPLTHILNTHHHWDHTDANLALKEHFSCQIWGNADDAQRIPGIDRSLQTGASVQVDDVLIQVLDVPGHTLGHLAYVLEDALFCGDVLFGAGCGRVFEGSHAQMWQSLQTLAALDGDTKVYCAHEYTLPNVRFALYIDADNERLKQRYQDDKQKRRQHLPTIPSTIELECATNPFLRPLHADFCACYAKQQSLRPKPAQVFSDIRKRKDTF